MSYRPWIGQSRPRLDGLNDSLAATDADQPRTYRIARFKTLRMLDVPARVPGEFDLREYFGNAWGVYRGDRTYDVEIRFIPEVAQVVTETVWHHTQKAKSNPDGSVTLTFQVDGMEEIANWILSWAGRARVIQPPNSGNSSSINCGWH